MGSKKTGKELVETYRSELIAQASDRPMTEKWEDHQFDKPPENAISDLEHTWQAIARGAGAPMPPILADFRSWPQGDHSEPLDDLALFVSRGHYPPPELLLAIVSAYETYLEGEGKLTLEECFFGKPKPKAGTHSARKARRFTELLWTIRLAVRSKGPGDDTRAAESIVEEDALAIDPETVLKAVNKHSRRIKSEK